VTGTVERRREEAETMPQTTFQEMLPLKNTRRLPTVGDGRGGSA
jgi:hypothetical protein